MPYLSRLTFLGIAKEVTIGTPVVPTLYIPYTMAKPVDLTNPIDDKSMFGNPSAVRGVYQGPADSTFDFDGMLYQEVIGFLMVAAGFADTVAVGRSVSDGADTTSVTITSATAAFVAGDVGATITGTDIPAGTTIKSVTNGTTAVLTVATTGTGSGRSWVLAGGAGSYQHKFLIPSAGTQPVTWTITDFNGQEARAWPGQMLDSLDFTFDAKGEIKYAAKFKGWPSVTASTPVAAFGATAPWLGWETTATMNAVADARIISGSWGVKRSSEVIHTLGNTRNPYTSFAGEVDSDVKVKMLFEQNTELNLFLNNTQGNFKLVSTAPTGSPAPVFSLISTTAAWKTGVTDRGPKYVQLDADIKPFYSATDAGPFHAELLNAVTTAY